MGSYYVEDIDCLTPEGLHAAINYGAQQKHDIRRDQRSYLIWERAVEILRQKNGNPGGYYSDEIIRPIAQDLYDKEETAKWTLLKNRARAILIKERGTHLIDDRDIVLKAEALREEDRKAQEVEDWLDTEKEILENGRAFVRTGTEEWSIKRQERTCTYRIADFTPEGLHELKSSIADDIYLGRVKEAKNRDWFNAGRILCEKGAFTHEEQDTLAFSIYQWRTAPTPENEKLRLLGEKRDWQTAESYLELGPNGVIVLPVSQGNKYLKPELRAAYPS